MNDELTRLRTDVDAEFSETGEALVPPAAGLPEALEDLLRSHYASEPAGDLYLAALEALSEATAWPAAPAGRAATSVNTARSASARTVQEALNAATSLARSALARGLNLNRDAADLLLERPAAALLTYPPGDVARAADLCGRWRGGVYKAVADSSRLSGGFVYAYRPGSTSTEPAKRAAEDGDQFGDLIAWGRGLFDAPRP